MNTKLTLRLDENLVGTAKAEAARRGKSVSQMVADFFFSLSDGSRPPAGELPPITRSLHGVLEGKGVSKEDYKKHLKEKYL